MVRLLLTLHSRAACGPSSQLRILWKISSTLFHSNFELVPICSSKTGRVLMLFIRGKLAQAIHRQKLPKMCCFSSLQHNNALMFLSPQNCPYLMIVRFNNCLDILAYIICGVLLKTAKISSWAWNLVGFFSLLLHISFRKKKFV